MCVVIACKQNGSKSKSYDRVSMKFLERWRVVQESDSDDDPITSVGLFKFSPDFVGKKTEKPRY